MSGVEFFKDMKPGGEGYQRAKEILTDDVNCIIGSILDYGRKLNKKCEIHIWDGHGNGGLIKGKIIDSSEIFYYPPQWFDMTKLLRERQIDAILFIGQHAMGRTPKANLCHTFSRKRVNYYLIHGKKEGLFVKELIGEIGFRAGMGSEFGVPTIFLSGDDKAVLEAKKTIPGIMAVTTKYGIGLEKARFRQLDKIRGEMALMVKKAIKKKLADETRMYKLDPPFELEIGSSSYLGVILNLCRGATWKGKKTSIFKADTFNDLDHLRKGNIRKLVNSYVGKK